ncbi:MAG: hydroxymethylglutaryl-CoA synthase [Planctomycetaceae bacterium]
MTEVGVSDISIYVPPFYLTHEDLARARGVDPEKYHLGLGNCKLSILPNWEDGVTMAANAASQLLEKTGTAPHEIGQLVVSTESGVDHSKPVASFVQGLLNIGERCRVYEIKHACYGGTAGLVNSIDWISQNCHASKKALVIMSDIARYVFGSPGEATQGAGAVALLVEKNPRLFSVNTSQNGIFSKDVFDFWRPTGHRVPIVDGKYSIDCYLEALEGAYSHLRSNLGIERGKLLENLDYLVYHMPFSHMAKKAHRHLIDLEYDGLGSTAKEQLFAQSFSQKVEPGLWGAREVGNIYTGSVYMGLIGLLETEGEKSEGKRIGIFSYGSGCGAEFFLCEMKTGTGAIIRGLRFKEILERRKRITFEKYVQTYSKSGEEIFYHPGEVEAFKDAFTRFVFTGFKEHRRQYL